ncbi:hypothetical protein JM84_1160 [Dokdonia sp. Hel_I_63]|uniref:three component ABC system middle component n=1 Tax=Dokdonia sp. Hel_I_63 TaxID=1249996 RepID=UPI00119C0B08|nr:three component ABC system middle component [Dokdonia sp. Hel_I_63]TVZ22269.1 hypothetical protein JM84_1160 [Dokdonia sp. Hel_I_63]
MNLQNYNNIGIASIAIHSVLSLSQELSLSEVLLIMPLFSSKSLTAHLSRKTTEIKSIEKLISEKTTLFSNFNKRYYDTLTNSLNAVQFLIETNKISIIDGNLMNNQHFMFDKSMGKRADKIYSASENVSKLLIENTEKLYLNLRIEL